MALTIPHPTPHEYAEFHRGYMSNVTGEPDAIAILDRQRRTIDALRQLTPQQAGHRYADGKWTVREIIGHLSDSERVFAYRLLCIARGETGLLPGFDEQSYAAQSNADRRTLHDLVDELAAVRASTLALVRSLDENALVRTGTVNQWSLSVRAIAFITAGHFAHHMNVLRDRYNVTL
jgi:uncharacterized damage-inducible protein DinB